MAITRSQIARQLLAEGGAPRIPFRSGGGRTDANTMSGSGYTSDANPSSTGFEGSPEMTGQGTATTTTYGGPVGGGGDDPPFVDTFRANQLKKQLDVMRGNTSLFGSVNPFRGPALDVYDKDFFDIDQYGMTGKDLTRSQNIQSALDKFQTTGRLSQSDFEKAFGSNVPTTTPGDNEVMVRKPIIPQLPTDIEPEKSDYDEFVQRFILPERFRLAEGGEPRQAYGLGKLVKKVTGAVKKVAKSPIGKAALLGTAAFGLPGTQFGGLFGRKAIGGGATGLFGSAGIADFFAKQALFADKAGDIVYGDSPFTKALNFMKTPKGALTTIGGITAATALLTPKQKEEVDSLSKRISDNTGIDVEQIRKEVQQATAEGQDSLDALKAKYPFLLTADAAKADGGRIGFDDGGIMLASNMENDKILEDLFEKYLDMGLSPKDAAEAAQKEFDRMSKKQDMDRTMAAGGGMMNPNDEMLDMGGNEMDLRGGGFVPIGEYEKKDDVPARLSKNEFVFTADAVRAAGGGSVDRGADLMYKTMKQLENKVV
jgi:hypothetical protein